MAKYRNINEAISRKNLNWLENYLMGSIEQQYEQIKSGKISLLDICKGAVDYSKYNHIFYNTREDRMEIYQMAHDCLSRIEDYMASQEGMTDDDMFPSHTNENKNKNNMKNTVRITEGQLKQMISESVRRVLNEIGDTNAGLATIKAAASKASDLGRHNQSKRFEDYGNKIDGGIIQRMTDKIIRFVNSENETVTIDTNGGVNGRSYNGGTIRYASKYFQVTNPRVARIIAKWVSEHVQNATPEMTDWHHYCVQ